MALLQQVDDTDARIVYSDKWSVNNNSNEYNHTSHGTNSNGAQATFKFQGTSIKVYGTLVVGLVPTLDTPTSSYTIDNGSPTTHHDTQLVSLPQTLYNQLFFQTTVPMDPNVEHTLVITMLSSGGSTFWIDKIVVGMNEPSSTVLSPTQVPSTAPAPINSPSTVVVTTSITSTFGSSTPTSATSIFRTSESSNSEPSTSKTLTSKTSSTPQSHFSSSSSFPTLIDNGITDSVSPTSSSQVFSATALASTSHKGISENATIGIALGVCIPAVALIIIGIFYLRRRRKKPVYRSIIPQYPIRSDWPSPKTTNTTSTDLVPGPSGRNLSVQTSRWEIIEPFPLHQEDNNSFPGASNRH